MALEKLKQVFEDANLKDAPRAEHGTPKFAHVNVLVDYINTLETTVNTLETRLAAREVVPVIPSYANNDQAQPILGTGFVYYNTTSQKFAVTTSP